MRILLDTHVFLWAVSEPSLLSASAVRALEDRSNTLYLSSVSVFEIATKVAIGKLDRQGREIPLAAWIGNMASRLGTDELLLTVGHAAEVESMPLVHSDPFDRLLVAQAKCENLAILTGDENIPRYDVETLW